MNFKSLCIELGTKTEKRKRNQKKYNENNVDDEDEGKKIEFHFSHQFPLFNMFRRCVEICGCECNETMILSQDIPDNVCHILVLVHVHVYIHFQGARQAGRQAAYGVCVITSQHFHSQDAVDAKVDSVGRLIDSLVCVRALTKQHTIQFSLLAMKKASVMAKIAKRREEWNEKSARRERRRRKKRWQKQFSFSGKNLFIFLASLAIAVAIVGLTSLFLSPFSLSHLPVTVTVFVGEHTSFCVHLVVFASARCVH